MRLSIDLRELRRICPLILLPAAPHVEVRTTHTHWPSMNLRVCTSMSRSWPKKECKIANMKATDTRGYVETCPCLAYLVGRW